MRLLLAATFENAATFKKLNELDYSPVFAKITVTNGIGDIQFAIKAILHSPIVCIASSSLSTM